MIIDLIRKLFSTLFKKKEDCYIRYIRYLLLNDGQVIGKPYRSSSLDIRVVYADSFSDAYRFFIKLCDQRLLKYRKVTGYLFYRIELPRNIGSLELSDKINRKNKEIIAVIKINVAEISPYVKEIRFMKPKRPFKNYTEILL